jgi:hypothetical protein
MRLIPIQFKPELNLDYTTAIVEVPNMLTKEAAYKLREFALSDDSGFHRRGSKDEGCNASFNCCLVFRLDDVIYDLIEPQWVDFIKKNNYDITFIEPYEIKEYSLGDKFGKHHDVHYNVDCRIDRKVNLVVQLSDETEYDGGDLYVGKTKCSRTLGTGIFFPAIYLHHVTEITRGSRYSLIGHAWGPTHK